MTEGLKRVSGKYTAGTEWRWIRCIRQKAFWGMKEYLKEKQVKGKKVLFLHTGGGPLFYDYLTKREKASLS